MLPKTDPEPDPVGPYFAVGQDKAGHWTVQGTGGRMKEEVHLPRGSHYLRPRPNSTAFPEPGSPRSSAYELLESRAESPPRFTDCHLSATYP